MKLHLIFGSSGSGKTAKLLEGIKHRERVSFHTDTWIIVPDQATFIMEKRVLNTLGDEEASRTRVFGLVRLASHILEKTGGVDRPFLDGSGKGVLVYRALRELHHKLPLFSVAIRKGGFSAIAAELAAEFKNYNIAPQDLRTAADAVGDQRLKAKVQELAIITEAINSATEACGYLDGEDRLSMAAARIADYPGIGSISLVVDKFSRLSPSQLLLLFSCMKHMEAVSITFKIAEPDFSRAYFSNNRHPTARLLFAVHRNAETSNIPLQVSKMEKIDFRHSPGSALAHFARNATFRGSTLPETIFSDISDDIRFVTHLSIEEEVNSCAVKIVSLCRDHGCTFKEIAVIVPEGAVYSTGCRRIFRLHGVPCFVDMRESLAGNPVSVALLAVFDVLRGGWRHDDVFRLLKSGLLPIDEGVVDRLENYALSVGLQGSKMWRELTFEVQELEAARVSLVQPLLDFRESLRREVEVKQALEAYVTLLIRWQLPSRIKKLSCELETLGRLDKAGHMRQIWQSACNLMDQIVEICAGGRLTLAELHSMMAMGLEGGSTGIIPPSLNEVFVATSSRSQLPEVKHLFLLGAAEGWIPKGAGTQDVLSDSDRKRLRACGLELAPDMREIAVEQTDELFGLLSMPTKSLWISRPLTDHEGKAVLPSTMLSDIKYYFPKIVDNWDLGDMKWGPEVEAATTTQALLKHLAPTIRQRKEIDTKLFGICSKKANVDQLVASLSSGFNWDNGASLSTKWIDEYFGENPRGSISALEMYRRCPFSWYAKYAASLRERKVAGPRDVGYGLLMHNIIDEVMKSAENHGEWEKMEACSISDLIEKTLGDIQKKGNAALGLHPSHKGFARWYLGRLANSSHEAVLKISRQLSEGSFRPVGHEVKFGDGGEFPPYKIRVPGGRTLNLQGRLDRLDVLQKNGQSYLRVVDYKSGDKKLSLSDMLEGIEMQLPAYLVVALSSMSHFQGAAGAIQPAGIFYMKVEPKELKLSNSMDVDVVTEKTKQMLLSGYILDDVDIVKAMDRNIESSGTSSIVKAKLNKDGTFSSSTRTLSAGGFKKLEGKINSKIGELAFNMFRGDISIKPLKTKVTTACSYCPYKDLCRFEHGVCEMKWQTPLVASEAENKAILEEGDE